MGRFFGCPLVDELLGREPLQRAVWTLLILLPAPRLDDAPGFLDAAEPVLVEALGSQLPVEGLDDPVVGGFAGTAEVELHPLPMDPLVHSMAGELR